MIIKGRKKPLWYYGETYRYVKACWNCDIDYNRKLHGKSYTIATDRRHRLWMYRKWQEFYLERIAEVDDKDWLIYWFTEMIHNKKIALRKLKRHNTYMKRIEASKS